MEKFYIWREKLSDPFFLLKLTAVFLYLFLLFFAIATQSEISSTIIAMITLIVFLIMFFPFEIKTNKNFVIFFLFVISFGTFLRLWLAYSYFGNFDMNSYMTASKIFVNGLNVYAETTFYNYSPLWFNVLGILRIFSDISSLPFHFIVKGFLTCMDLFSLILLLSIGISEGFSKNQLVQLSLFFYLNPVIYLITGYHGQFENFALFFILLGLFFFIKMKNGSNYVKYFSWISFSIGLIVKHDTLILVLSGMVNLFKKTKYIIVFFIASLTLFLFSFIFYWSTGSQGIISNVFLYGGISGIYGITSVANIPGLKYLFICGLLIYPFLIREREIGEQFLLGSLFFITFTTGIGIQYFVLPIAFGALRPSNWFLLYSFVATLVILGSFGNLYLYGFNFITLNAIWICAIFWFMFTHFNIKFQ